MPALPKPPEVSLFSETLLMPSCHAGAGSEASPGRTTWNINALCRLRFPCTKDVFLKKKKKGEKKRSHFSFILKVIKALPWIFDLNFVLGG